MKTKKIIKRGGQVLSLILFSLTVVQCHAQSHHVSVLKSNMVKAEAPDTNVENQQGYLLEASNTGLAQSPVNIVTNNAKDYTTHKVILNYKTSTEHVVNLGHTIQVNYDKGNSITFDDTTFDFKQFHFHTPSEHLVDGITYPMEMHMVHTLKGLKEGNTPVYLVIGAFFKEGKENPFLNEFLDDIPKDNGGKTINKNKTVDVKDLLNQANVLSYYNYQGSLTTPPYTETVTWLVLKQVFEASPEQIKKFNKLEGNNARHVQALNKRIIDKE